MHLKGPVTTYCRLASRRLGVFCALISGAALILLLINSYGYYARWYSSGAFIKHRFRTIPDIGSLFRVFLF